MMNPLDSAIKYSVYIDQTLISFKEDFGRIGPIETDESLPINTNWSSELTRIVNLYRTDGATIRSRYPNGLSTIENLDFSNLGLTTLPPHILLECKAAQSLDLSGNHIGRLPIQLKKLPLRNLNISGNKGLNFHLFEYDWLKKMPGLHIVANDIGFNFRPRGWEGRFSSNDLPSSYDPDWDCPTQLSSDESDG